MSVVDDYIKDVIIQGDEGSALLRAKTAGTLRNSDLVEVLGRNVVLRIPEGQRLVVYSTGGNPGLKDPLEYASSLVHRLIDFSKKHSFKPIGFANVVDTPDGSCDTLEAVAAGLVEQSNRYGIAVLNGENAILGSRVNAAVNVSGTMIALVNGSSSFIGGINGYSSMPFSVFDPEGKPVFINCDGVGTKTEFYERKGNFAAAIDDLLAMNLDDAIKLGATARIFSGIIEVTGNIPGRAIQTLAGDRGQQLGIDVIMHYMKMRRRLQSFPGSRRAYNLNGGVVSTIDEERISNPLCSSEGEYLVAISGTPNPRSNGISSRRRVMVETFGEQWHQKRDCADLLDYLSTPSTVLYPVFKSLIDGGLASNVYHLSGGAYNGKLAKPLAEQGLFVHLNDLPALPDAERMFMGISGATAEKAYAQWPMGVDGFVSTSAPHEVVRRVREMGLHATPVGRLESANAEQSGVKITAVNGETVYFSGRE